MQLMILSISKIAKTNNTLYTAVSGLSNYNGNIVTILLLKGLTIWQVCFVD